MTSPTGTASGPAPRDSRQVIETERLVLRPLTLQDLDAFVALHADPEVTRFVPSYPRGKARARLTDIERQWAERGHGLCAVELKDTGEFIGRCGLNHWEQFDEVEAGWTFQRASWGRGYATEAARACVAWGFEHLDAEYFTAMIAPGNTASAKVAERLGFTPARRERFLGLDVVVHTLHRPNPGKG